MVDISVALTWIAISAASVKGLSAFARAATAVSVEVEPIGDGPHGQESHFPMTARSRLLEDRG
jgi:hypothetical protein